MYCGSEVSVPEPRLAICPVCNDDVIVKMNVIVLHLRHGAGYWRACTPQSYDVCRGSGRVMFGERTSCPDGSGLSGRVTNSDDR